MSFVEAIANVVFGYGIALLTQMLLFPIFGLRLALAESAAIAGAFTIVSIIRSYVLRRLFEGVRLRGSDEARLPPGSTLEASVDARPGNSA
jgi:hypothetical protein